VLRNGRKVRGDALIGADGVRSVVRNMLWGACDPGFSGMVAWRGLIPMEVLPQHMQVSVGTTWIGPGGHAVSYPLHRSKIMNFVATIEGKRWDATEGSVIGTTEECLADFFGWHEDVQTLIRNSPRLIKWALMQRDPIPRWTNGRITLMGDAAHATLPFLAQGAVHSIEDGMVLSRCLEGVALADIPAALSRYEAARIERTSRMVRGATANTERFHSRELATEESAERYLQLEWSAAPIFERYDWLYRYDANTAPI
jgi:salicylate hydroxylase